VPILAELVDVVIGADTHRDTHTLEMCSPAGATLARITVANTDAGFADALTWVAEHAPGPRMAAGLEGTRSYGVGLARVLSAAGMQVIEVEQPRRADRRGRGKSDPIDAHLAALSVLRREVDTLCEPRADGRREGLRILLGARRDLVTGQTAHINQLRALLLGGDDTDRAPARGALPKGTLATIARRRGTHRDPVEQVIRRRECRRLALAIIASRAELAENKQQLAELVDSMAPRLLGLRGVGPVSAAQVIVSWSHPGRCRDEASFAALGGVCPRPASSGRTIRHRLNRGGDRALNRALHDIVMTRWRVCSRTHDYVDRRRAEGKSDREIRRCLKRYVARELHRELTRAMA
jgi:transposase